MLRLTLTAHGIAHVFPWGGAVAATLTYRVLRRRGLDPEKVGLALAAVSVLVYGTLAVLLAGSPAYMLVMGDLGPVPTASSCLLLVLTLGGVLFAYATLKRELLASRVCLRTNFQGKWKQEFSATSCPQPIPTSQGASLGIPW